MAAVGSDASRVGLIGELCDPNPCFPENDNIINLQRTNVPSMASAPFLLRLLICLAYLGVGIFVLVYKPFNSPLFDWPFALACVTYGSFRAYRAYTDYRNEMDES